MNNTSFQKKVRITGNIEFETAFHIGSGKEGEMATDMGVLLSPDGTPLLPGSTLKGCFRSFAEKLAGHLDMSACLLDEKLSGIKCVGSEAYRKKIYEEMEKKRKNNELASEKDIIKFLAGHTCEICRFFGSPMQASRIFFTDGTLTDWGGTLQIRDGVCIDRDTETARSKLKYDYEVVPRGAVFSTCIEIENSEDNELAIVAAALGEWENGFRIGGFTSRGLGKARFTDKKVESVDYTQKDQFLDYLISQKMQSADALLDDTLAQALSR